LMNSSTRLIIKGWFLITSSYLLTYMFAMIIYHSLFPTPADLDQETSGLFVGVFMIIVPYAVVGTYVRKKNVSNPVKTVLLLTLLPVIGEKLGIYMLGSLLLKGGGDAGATDGVTTMGLIGGDCGLPYFTPFYFFCSIISVGIALLIAVPINKFKFVFR